MSPPTNPISIIVHGGAWNIPASLHAANKAGVERAAEAGYKMLASGGSCIDAVMQAVKTMEDDATFDAGFGSVLTRGGTVEMDAGIMDDTPEMGAVGCVGNVKNAVALAREVMKSEHVLLVGQGAERFAETVGKDAGVEMCDMNEHICEAAKMELREYKGYGSVVANVFCGNDEPHKTSNGHTNGNSNDDFANHSHDTVGAVAVDKLGRVCVATSTGGITMKRPGRVGDSPLVGCGYFCERAVGGCSTTGHGESIAKVCLAHSTVRSMQSAGARGEEGLKEILEAELEGMRRKTGGRGGLIAADCLGNTACAFTTKAMAWASVGAGGVRKSAVTES